MNKPSFTERFLSVISSMIFTLLKDLVAPKRVNNATFIYLVNRRSDFKMPRHHHTHPDQLSESLLASRWVESGVWLGLRLGNTAIQEQIKESKFVMTPDSQSNASASLTQALILVPYTLSVNQTQFGWSEPERELDTCDLSAVYLSGLKGGLFLWS